MVDILQRHFEMYFVEWDNFDFELHLIFVLDSTNKSAFVEVMI